MNLLTLIEKREIHLSPQTKVVPAEEFSELIQASEIITRTKEEETAYRLEIAKECESLKELAESAGFEEGLKKWNEQIEHLESEIRKVRQDTENALVPLAVTAVKKIIGRELETKPETIVDIVATALKTVLHHRRITIYAHPEDRKRLEEHNAYLRSLFERLESLSFNTRADIQRGGCIIETEAGIINANLENQLKALESAFQNFFQNRSKGSL
jgi:type III secretion protein L